RANKSDLDREYRIRNVYAKYALRRNPDIPTVFAVRRPICVLRIRPNTSYSLGHQCLPRVFGRTGSAMCKKHYTPYSARMANVLGRNVRNPYTKGLKMTRG